MLISFRVWFLNMVVVSCYSVCDVFVGKVVVSFVYSLDRLVVWLELGWCIWCSSVVLKGVCMLLGECGSMLFFSGMLC